MKSRCTYCGSCDYGKGCRFGPQNTHFHLNDGKKCAYCGSGSFGRGCKINPTSDLHIHGIHYNTMFKESMQEFVEQKLLLHQLKKDFVDFPCFKLGIIDKQGNKIREPLSENEKASYGPFTKTIIKLKKYLGSKVDLIDAEFALSESSLQVKDIIVYKKILEYQDRINNHVNGLYKIIEEAQQEGLSLDSIKNLIKA
jgi:hypothetical protein